MPDSAAPSPRLPTIRETLARVHLRLVLLAVLLSGAMLMVSGLVTIRDYFERNLALVASTVSYAVEPAIVFGDAEAMRDGVGSVARLHDVRLVELRDADGRLLTRWTPPGGDVAAGETLTERLLGVELARQAIHRGDQTIGEVRVAGDTSMLTGYLLSGALISLCCLGLTVLAMRLLAKRMDEGVVAPLSDIASVAHEVRSQRAFDRRVSPSGIAEVDKFGRDFNALLAELEGWHSSLTAEKDKLAHDATHDPLTGLGNRALLERSLQAAVGDELRPAQPFALLYLDADHFKQVNDRHGHQAGDTLLIGIANRLRSSIRLHDHAFRLGGDEFAVVLGPTVDHARLATVVGRIETAMAEPVDLPSGKAILPSLSIGAAIYPDDGGSPADLLRRADELMYQNKLRKRDNHRTQGSHA
jgi:diguanylate cyclase (GGDEF)-like protein